MLSRVYLLGVPIDPVQERGAVERLQELLVTEGQHHVMTPNSEMLVMAHRNPAFKKLLQTTALNLPDSVGLVWLARLTGQWLPARVTGVDTVQRLCESLDDSHGLFLLGAAEGVAEVVAGKLILRPVSAKATPGKQAQDDMENGELKISGCFSGRPDIESESDICQRINESDADILLVAYGAPQQDEWIARNLPHLPKVKLAMGVGGTFDFIAGKQKRAPRWLQAMGLEWAWRLMLEPRRLGRILRATVVFPLLVLRFGRGRPKPLQIV